MAAHSELSFLYQTRTILRCHPRVSCTSRRRRLFSSQPQAETSIDHEAPGIGHGHGGFLKEKARQVAESSKAPKAPSSIPNTVGTRVNSTITASERRAFETILRFTPRQAEPSGVKHQSPMIDAVDTDVESILNIFSSSMRSRHGERDETVQKAVKPLRTPDQNGISLDVAAPQANVASTLSNSEAQVDLDQQLPDRPQRQHLSPAAATTTTNPQSTMSDDLPPGEQSLEEITQSLRVSSHDASIQEEVRTRMSQIANALQTAATSTTKRGDIAMWEVCETQIFSMASQLAPPARERLHQPTDPPRFTFTRSHSDNPSELMEVAARASGATHHHTSNATDPVVPRYELPSSSSSPSSSSATEASLSLPALHHVYPAALLLALRLYIHHFPSSPLAHNLLPRIRAFGHTSYVLGAGSQFYNSLLSLVWMTRSSLRQVDALLAEMERGGVELTEETYRILRQIEDERAADLGRGEGNHGVPRGSRGAAWWKRHEQVFWFPRVLDWLSIVAKRLTMKEMVEEGQR
ncbi:hypothetical protein A1O1_03174 [Capronia coronata CBS 617.96]|uniref:Mtf2-like C-terminal domain-containing protein n=1 Tax=Capronia coronata CBS 617.96 TaxID=1182541 RepID=W9YZP5_9EURO|nr:uncharacterized protein A1O1_03174 [Capronia coronata CBS 617.96]EXJ94776.1 hypothetical protein A1O1_03174 [Capronia coronata CBS 617.96]